MGDDGRPTGPTLEAVKKGSALSVRSAVIIVPLVVTASILGSSWLGGAGRWLGAFVGFLAGVFIEMYLVAWRLGVSRNAMLICRGLKARGRVGHLANEILSLRVALRSRDFGGATVSWQAHVDRLTIDLLKALNGVALYPGIEGYQAWERKCQALVKDATQLGSAVEKGDLEITVQRLLKLRLRARSLLSSIIQQGG